MDIQMPLMNGFEATKNIRALGSDYSELPIIAMTADSLPVDKEKCLSAGMNDYVSKPFSPDELLEALAKWIIPN